MSTLKELRNQLRNIIGDWPDISALTSGVDAVAETVSVANLDRFRPGGLIQVDAEIMLVRAVNTANLTVRRAYAGTVAASHVASAPVYIIDKYSDAELNSYINAGILALWPVIFEPVEVDFPLLADTLTMNMPTGWDELFEIQLRVEEGEPFRTFRAWQLHAGKIEFLREIPAGVTLKFKGGKKHAPLATDDSPFPTSIAPIMESGVLDFAMYRLLSAREAQRTEFTEYSASLNDRASRPGEIGNSALRFLQRFQMLRAENATLKRKGFIRRPVFRL